MGAALAATSIACDVEEGRPAGPSYRDDNAAGPASRYYRVTRDDIRRCIAPLCGGVWVAALNQNETRCSDGTYAADCYVGVTELGKLGLSEDGEGKLTEIWESGAAIIQGDLEEAKVPGTDFVVGTLYARSAWVGVTRSDPRGTFAAVSETADGFAFSPLNGGAVSTARGLDLEGAGLSETEAAAALEELADHGVLVAGGSRPAEIYRRFDVRELQVHVCSDRICPFGQTCCNPSCGICTPPGVSCLDVVCDPED